MKECNNKLARNSDRFGVRQLGKLAMGTSGLILILTGCAQEPADMVQMSEAITATLIETSPPAAQASRSAVSLEDGFAIALLRAVQANEGYQAALALETEALGQIGVVSSVRRPQVAGNANLGGLREIGGNTTDDTSYGVTGGVNISQLLYDGGESTAAVNQATAEAMAAQSERKVQGNNLALQAARAWIDVWQYDERLRVLRSRTSEMNMLVNQIERMAVTGMVDRAALDSALRQIVDISLQETRLEAELRDAQVRFHRFFNRAPGKLAQPADLFTPSQARLAAQSWQHAPDLERKAAELLVARSAVDGAEAAFRPRALLKGGINAPMQSDEATEVHAGVAVEFNLLDGGQRRSKLEAVEARLDSAKAQLIDSKRILEADLDAALGRLSASEQSMPLLEKKIRLSTSEARTARSQIATGQSTLRELVEAEIEKYRAEDSRIAMRAERQVLLLTIAAKTGQLGELIGLENGQGR